MPGLMQAGRKRPSIVLSDNESDEEDEQSGYSSSISVGSKRARISNNASSSRNENHGRNGLTNGFPTTDGFPPGSLVRVKLKNFVTYTAAEFHLGPSLNMIIGPNGTGKSTLVCAICLGLGWASEHLGRAKEIGLFVKNGSTEADIEIELAKGPDMSRNPVVRRMIRKEDNKSIFWINGKQASKTAVLELCKRFSIQIDNLCQFLPQDRVVEFAKMSDVDRLRETQRAAAPPRMVEWHDQLKELRAEEKVLETNQLNEKRHLESLERQQVRDQADVDRFQQREGLLRKAKCLSNVRPIIELRLRKKDYEQAKAEIVGARRELDQIKADIEPAQRAQAEVDTYRDQIDEIVKIRKHRVEGMKKRADKFVTDLEKEKQAATSFTAEINAELSSKKDRDRDVVRTTNEIQTLERRRQEEPVAYDATVFTQKFTELRAQISAKSNRLTERQSTSDSIRDRVHTLGQQYQNLRSQRAQLDTQDGQQKSILASLSRDTAAAWQWFEANKEDLPLKGEVFGPSVLTCTVRDPRYADAVESQLKKGDLLAITCTNAEDQKLLSDRLFNQQNNSLRLHDVYLRSSPRSLSQYQSTLR